MKGRHFTRHRTAFILVITLILGFAIVAAAVLIPVLMASKVVTLPARFPTFAVAASSVNMKAHGKYILQGAQVHRLAAGQGPLANYDHDDYKSSNDGVVQDKSHEREWSTRGEDENNDPHRPHDSTFLTSRRELHRPRWMPNPHMPWVVNDLQGNK
ncbi:hypothetical protein J6590_040222 [Homalodisca vitripennis]|nr:hypothetical protein J6590_040222 [Homalodisca vitripennis]